MKRGTYTTFELESGNPNMTNQVWTCRTDGGTLLGRISWDTFKKEYRFDATNGTEISMSVGHDIYGFMKKLEGQP